MSQSKSNLNTVISVASDGNNNYARLLENQGVYAFPIDNAKNHQHRIATYIAPRSAQNGGMPKAYLLVKVLALKAPLTPDNVNAQLANEELTKRERERIRNYMQAAVEITNQKVGHFIYLVSENVADAIDFTKSGVVPGVRRNNSYTTYFWIKDLNAGAPFPAKLEAKMRNQLPSLKRALGNRKILPLASDN